MALAEASLRVPGLAEEDERLGSWQGAGLGEERA